MTKYEIENRFLEALAKPGELNPCEVHDEIESKLKKEFDEIQASVRKVYDPLFKFNDDQLDAAMLVLQAYRDGDLAMHDFAVKYIAAAADAVSAGGASNEEEV